MFRLLVRSFRTLTSGTVTNPTTTTGKPGQYDKVTAILRVPDEDCTFPDDSVTIRKHLAKNEKMYIDFSNGDKLVMETNDNNETCQWSGRIDPDVKVTGFSMTVNGKIYSLTVDNGGYQYTRSSTVTFNVKDDGTVNYSS